VVALRLPSAYEAETAARLEAWKRELQIHSANIEQLDLNCSLVQQKYDRCCTLIYAVVSGGFTPFVCRVVSIREQVAASNDQKAKLEAELQQTRFVREFVLNHSMCKAFIGICVLYSVECDRHSAAKTKAEAQRAAFQLLKEQQKVEAELVIASHSYPLGL
jgi:hypothetical protein